MRNLYIREINKLWAIPELYRTELQVKRLKELLAKKWANKE